MGLQVERSQVVPEISSATLAFDRLATYFMIDIGARRLTPKGAVPKVLRHAAVRVMAGVSFAVLGPSVGWQVAQVTGNADSARASARRR
jgi:hypothetical protein